MTEQWQELKETIIEMRDNNGTCTQQEVCRFLANLMDLLEKQTQEPCEDAISRQAVLDAIDKWVRNMHVLVALPANEVTPLFESMHELPPITPQPKTGHWIKSRDCYGNNHFTCSFCGNDIATKYDGIWKDNYCSNCGAKMESEE